MVTGGFDPELVKADCGWACECKGFIVRQVATESFEGKGEDC